MIPKNELMMQAKPFAAHVFERKFQGLLLHFWERNAASWLLRLQES